MRKIWKRIAVAMLAALLLVGSLPASAKSATPDFAALIEKGENNYAEIEILTDPIYALSWVGVFAGPYVPYQDYTGQYGVADPWGHALMTANIGNNTVCEMKVYRNGIVLIPKEKAQTEGNVEFRTLGGKRLSPTSWSDPFFDNTACDYATGAESFVRGQIKETPTAEVWKEFLLDAAGHALIADQLGKVYNGLVPFRNGEKWGLWNLDRKEVLPCVYGTLSFVTKDCLIAERDGKFVLIDPQGKQLKALDGVTEAKSLAPQYDPYILVKKGGLWGILDAQGKTKLDCLYTKFYITEVDNRGDYTALQDGMWYYLDDLSAKIPMYEGDESVNPGYKIVAERLAKKLYCRSDSDGKQIVDQTGKELLPDHFDYVAYQDGLILATKTVDPSIPLSETMLYDESLRLIATVSGETGLVHAIHSYAICENDTVTFYAVKDGKKLGKVTNASVTASMSGSYVLKRGTKYAVADEQGKLLTDFLYDSLFVLRWDRGLYQAQIGQKYILLNARGKELTPQTDEMVLFSDDQITPYTSYRVNGKVGFLRLYKPDEPKFSDVQAKSWYAKGVNFCTNAGLMNGVSAASFAPQNKMTRAMLVRVLYNLSGSKCASYGFTDVPAGKWYTDAVNWAAANGIVNGVSATSFAPDAPVTREQMVTILHRYASQFGSMKGKADALNGFEDAGKVSKYAKDAMCWAISAGIVNGKTKTTVDPQGQATRAEIATILLRFVKLMAG